MCYTLPFLEQVFFLRRKFSILVCRRVDGVQQFAELFFWVEPRLLCGWWLQFITDSLGHQQVKGGDLGGFESLGVFCPCVDGIP